MGLYVEVCCDIAGPDCEGMRGDNPNGRTVEEAKAEAVRVGWTIGRGRKASCPSCLSSPQANPHD